MATGPIPDSTTWDDSTGRPWLVTGSGLTLLDNSPLLGYGPIPDGAQWADSTGRTWSGSGGLMLYWADPTITLLGDNPTRLGEGGTYTEQGATAVDALGADLTSDIVTDSSAVDTDTAGTYPVLYTVTDDQGGTSTVERAVVVLAYDQVDVRDRLYLLLRDGLPDGVQVYDHPAEQVKPPAVTVGTMDWTPAVMDSLRRVDWAVTIRLSVQRSKPAENVHSLELLSIKVGQLLSVAGVRTVGFTGEETVDIGGTPLLTGTLEVMYRQTVEE